MQLIRTKLGSQCCEAANWSVARGCPSFKGSPAASRKRGVDSALSRSAHVTAAPQFGVRFTLAGAAATCHSLVATFVMCC